jgi:hypothetical protein
MTNYNNKDMKHRLKQNRINLLMILFFVFISLGAHSADKAELVVNISNCRNSEEFAHLFELTVLKDGKKYEIVKPGFEREQTFKDLELGTYTLVYKSLFGKQEHLQVEITEYKKYITSLCIDFLDYTKEKYKPIIDRLQESDFYTLSMSSQGCFHFKNDSVTIKRNKDIYTINWGEKSKKLSAADIETIRHFETELNYMKDGGCTTTDTYIIRYNGATKKISDGGCNWNGDYFLKKELFGD